MPRPGVLSGRVLVVALILAAAGILVRAGPLDAVGHHHVAQLRMEVRQDSCDGFLNWNGFGSRLVRSSLSCFLATL